MFFKNLAAGVAVAGASLALVALSAKADPYRSYAAPSAADEVTGVTVYAPDRLARQPTTGRWTRMDTISMNVSLADLDLSTAFGARIAKARISRAAKEVCDAFDQVYPGDTNPPGGCYSIAVRDALRQAQDQAGYPIVAWGYR
jgi:UrcA family protein